MRLRTTWTGGGRITSSCIVPRAKAVLRVVFRPQADFVEVKGFGHRFKPSDIYHRLVLGKDIRL